MTKFLIPAILYFLVAAGAKGQSKQPPLFDSKEILEFTLISNYNNVTEDVYGDSKDHKGKLIYRDSAENRIKVQVELETRGNFRRNPDNCDFPPLEIDFDGEYDHTVFQGQSKLKLVNHCRDTLQGADENVVKEYLIYRIFNIITTHSFQVRLCKINYRQSWSISGDEHMAFLIEDNDMMAERLGGKELDAGDDYLPLDSLCLAKMALFQYLIGNTDWTVMPLQNMEIIKVPGKGSYPVPYDFDLSAFVNTVYAPQALFIEPDELFERKYRGPELSSKYVKKAVEVFIRKKKEIKKLVKDEELLSEKERQRLLAYIASFYEDIETNNIKKR